MAARAGERDTRSFFLVALAVAVAAVVASPLAGASLPSHSTLAPVPLALLSPTSTPPHRTSPSSSVIAQSASAISVTNRSSGPSWVFWNNSTQPPTRLEGGLAYDPAEGGVILFGGDSTGGSYLNDTWLFRQGEWTELCTGNSSDPSCPTSPPTNYGASLAYDYSSSELVAVNLNCYCQLGDQTWVFQNGSWRAPATAANPPTGVIAYDWALGKLVLVGYSAGVGYQPKTWYFENDTWMLTNVTGTPWPSSLDLMYDPSVGGLLFWGGVPNATWEFVQGNWTQLSPATGPSKTSWSALAYDPALGTTILLTQGPHNTVVTWFWRGGAWVNVTATTGWGPSGANFGGAAYDANDGYELFEPWWATAGQRVNQSWLLRNPMTATFSEPSQIGEVGEEATFSMNASGGIAPYTFSNLSGLSSCQVTSDGSTGATAVCTLSAVGSFTVDLTVRDAVEDSVNVSLVLDVSGEPTLGAVALPNPVTVGVPVILRPTLLGFVSVQWTLCNGSVITAETIRESFATPESCPVTMVAVDVFGVVRTANLTITVNPKLSVSMVTTSVTTDIGLPVQLVANVLGGTPPLSYEWKVAPDWSVYTPTADLNFTAVGTFSPELFVNDSGGASVNESALVVVNPAVEDLSIEVLNLSTAGQPVGLLVIFGGGTPPYDIAWRFDDGGTAEGQWVNHTFATEGVHRATAFVNDSVGSAQEVSVAIETASSGAPVNTTLPTTVSPPKSTSGTVAIIAVLSVALGVVLVLDAVALSSTVRTRRRGGSLGHA